MLAELLSAADPGVLSLTIFLNGIFAIASSFEPLCSALLPMLRMALASGLWSKLGGAVATGTRDS